MKTTKLYVSSMLIVAAVILAALRVRAESPSTPPDGLARAEHAIATRGFSVSRLTALGHAQIEAGQLGPGIASFERGLLLSPRDPQLRAALQQARAQAGLPAVEAETWLSRIAHELSLREWAVGAFASLLLLSLALFGLGLTTRRRRAFSALLALAGLTSAGALAGVVYDQADLKRAYVVRDDSPVLQSPFEAADAVLSLRAGESVKEIEHHAGFVYVETDHGVLGWMAEKCLAPLAIAAHAHT